MLALPNSCHFLLNQFFQFSEPVDLSEIVKKYQYERKFADRRQDVYSARTYIYEGEEKCDENRDVFLDCIETTGKNYFKSILLFMLDVVVLLMFYFATVNLFIFFPALTIVLWYLKLLAKIL